MSNPLLNSILRLIGKTETASGAKPAEKAETAETTEHLDNIEQNKQAMQSVLDSSNDKPVVLRHSIRCNDKLTSLELTADALHMTQDGESRTVPLNDSLEEYSQLDEELRSELARKISRLVPDLAYSKHTLLLDHTLKVLKTLSQDQTERVRVMIAEELCDSPDVPLHVMQALAWDERLSVRCPILQYSPLLQDSELLEILASSPVPGVADAIAKRRTLSQDVTGALVQTGFSSTIGNVLENKRAELSPQSLDMIIDLAPEQEIWHEPLVQRPELTQRTMNRIAGFVSGHLIEEMKRSYAMNQSVQHNVQQAVQSRLQSVSTDEMRQGELNARHAHRAGMLDAERVSTALDMGDEAFVTGALICLSGFDARVVRRIIESGSARSITALAWKCGLPMRTATQIQLRMGKIHHTKVLNARDGVHYPLPKSELEGFLEMFGT